MKLLACEQLTHLLCFYHSNNSAGKYFKKVVKYGDKDDSYESL
jgi:hypothetical protein